MKIYHKTLFTFTIKYINNFEDEFLFEIAMLSYLLILILKIGWAETTKLLGGTSSVTTTFAPIVVEDPTVIGPRTFAPDPIVTSLSITGRIKALSNMSA